MKEAKIQCKIIASLEATGWLVVKIIQTNKNGWPDLMAFKDGKAVCIEVKSPGKKPTPLQLMRHADLAIKGIETYITSDENFSL
jgi:Holliday junction resolvase